MTYDPDRDTQAPRADSRAPGPPLNPAAGIGNIKVAIILLALLFVGGFAWIIMSNDTNVATNQPAATTPATTGSGSNTSY